MAVEPERPTAAAQPSAGRCRSRSWSPACTTRDGDRWRCADRPTSAPRRRRCNGRAGSGLGHDGEARTGQPGSSNARRCGMLREGGRSPWTVETFAVEPQSCLTAVASPAARLRDELGLRWIARERRLGHEVVRHGPDLGLVPFDDAAQCL